MKSLNEWIWNLPKDVEDIDDSETYRKLLQSESDGAFPASEEEQKEFRKWLIPRGEAYAKKAERTCGKKINSFFFHC